MATVAPAVSRPALVRVGTVVWLSSEVMFFGALFAAYFTLRPNAQPWPPPGVHLDALRAGAFTVVLLGSSVTAQAGVRASERADRDALRRWFLVTVGLGAVFLANQALEWRGTGFTPRSHAYGSMYYLMTGLHGLHVLGGLVALLAIVARASVERAGEAQEAAVAAVGYYWHFVDVVWVALYATLFLIR
jgi:cytochrome c oxidase subunit 3